ncbi:hypothetical protein ACFSPU_12325 [Haoranjiania flava]|uniref:hypothetical protein n=1 Tax=Haoranjiania flava TaxID=1856322 RepID=UPI003628B149
MERLYRLMGISASAPGPNTSNKGKGKGHEVFPYLLKNLAVTRSNQVWAMDITYSFNPKHLIMPDCQRAL